MRSQSTSWAMVRWSVSKPSRGPPRRDPQRLGRPGAGQRRGRRPRRPGRRGARAARARRRCSPGWSVDRAVRRGVADQPRPRVAPGQRLAGHGLGPQRLAEHGPVGGDVGDLDAQHEPHRVQPRRQRRRTVPGSVVIQVVSPSSTRCRSCSMWPLGLSTSDSADVSGREAGEHLGGDRVQPGQPVGAGDRHDPAVGQVDGGEALGEQPLLAQRVAVVRGDARVGAVGRDGAGRREQGAGRDRRGCHCLDCWEHAAHHPWIAMCLTSATKPWRARRFPTNASASPIGLSVTRPAAAGRRGAGGRRARPGGRSATGGRDGCG